MVPFLAGSRPRKCQGFSSSLKAGGKDQYLNLKAVRQERILFYQEESQLFTPSTDWIGPTHLGRAICFTQSSDSMLGSPKTTFT